MHPFSVVTVVIFVAGYITARWDLVTRFYELAIFAVDRGVLVGDPMVYRIVLLLIKSPDSYSQRIRHLVDILLPPRHTY